MSISRRKLLVAGGALITISPMSSAFFPILARAIMFGYRVYKLSGRSSKIMEAVSYTRQAVRVRKYLSQDKKMKEIKSIAKDQLDDLVDSLIARKVYSAIAAQSIPDEYLEELESMDSIVYTSSSEQSVYLSIINNSNENQSDEAILYLEDMDSKLIETSISIGVEMQPNSADIYKVGFSEFKNTGRKKIYCVSKNGFASIPSSEFTVVRRLGE